jgi:hypothetical protein
MGETAQSTPWSDQQLATHLAKLWPHREHEAASFSGLLCRVGLHCWRRLETGAIAPQRQVRFCFWCPAVKIDRHIYMP